VSTCSSCALLREFEEESEYSRTRKPRRTRRMATISGFPRYSQSVTSLPAAERAKIVRVARFLGRALRSGEPALRAVQLVGHVDLDTPRRPAFERRIATSRAQMVRLALVRALDILDRKGLQRPAPLYSSRVAWRVESAGATQPVVPNPRSELERRRNRRVEISLVSQSGPADLRLREARYGLAEAPLSNRLQKAVDDFLRRAPNDLIRYDDPVLKVKDLPDRRVCVRAVAMKAVQLCRTAADRDRDVPCAPPLTLRRGRCLSQTRGVEILSGKDYRAPLIAPFRCCDWSSDCAQKANADCLVCRSAGKGQYLVLQYKPGPLRAMVGKLKCLLDRGCAVPVAVLSGTCDDKPDTTCSAPPQNRWRDCWEHWLLVIGYDGDRFVFWDSAGTSAIGPLRPDKDNHHFGILHYDSAQNRFSTASPDPSIDGLEVTGPVGPHDPAGFHTQGVQGPHLQKRYQVVSMWAGLPSKADGGPCPKV